ncbi:MAG: response regulator [Acidobacteriota bacterium]|nr:response regulator [Acidobacteriota bacterium]
MNILIVDGDRAASQLLSQHLNQTGHHAGVAFDAQHAVMTCARARPHLVILDLQLSGEGGPEVLQRLKTSPKTAMVPVIVLTASAEHEQAALAMGADAFLVKSPDFRLLDAALERCVPSGRLIPFPEPVDDVAVVFPSAGANALAPELAQAFPEPSAIVRNILVVDDDPVVSNLVAHCLKHSGFTIFFAGDIPEATRILDSCHVDAVILDLELPSGHGLDVIQHIRSFARTGDVRIFVVSGTTDDHGADFALAAGADRFFPKPPDMDRVIEALREYYPAPSLRSKPSVPWLVQPV